METKGRTRNRTTKLIGYALAALTLTHATQAQSQVGAPVPVTAENYNRAQTDVYFAGVVRRAGLGKLFPGRELARPVQQGIVRGNRDTLYSFAIFDLNAGHVAITLPDPGKRFMVLQVVNEDQYTKGSYYGAGSHTLTKEMIGTRYAIAVIRYLVDFSNQHDVEQVHALQDATKFSQERPGTFEIPNWDPVSLNEVKSALLQLGTTISDSHRMFGASEDQVDPVKHLIGSALIWGGSPEKDTLYLPITPEQNDGRTVYKLKVGDVPVDAFWSVTVYNSQGYLVPNQYNVYAVNSVNAKKDADGSVTIQFGEYDGKTANCIPITPGWNYMVRLFLPRAEILDGSWKFPLAQPAK